MRQTTAPASIIYESVCLCYEFAERKKVLKPPEEKSLWSAGKSLHETCASRERIVNNRWNRKSPMQAEFFCVIINHVAGVSHAIQNIHAIGGTYVILEK